MDKYRNFKELKLHEKEGAAFEICVRIGDSGIAVLAPHGGGIEPGTGDIADHVAGLEHTFYGFKGIKKTGNKNLHIASVQFDEPEGMRIAQTAQVVLTIHGCTGNGDVIMVGGGNRTLKEILITALTQAGFYARESDRVGLKGAKPDNICNRGLTGKGGQIEISAGLRNKMFDRLPHGKVKGRSKVFHNLVAALRKALEEYAALQPPVCTLHDGAKNA